MVTSKHGAARAAPRQKQKTASENIIRLEHDHHFNLTSGPRFHADHANLCTGVVQITTGELSKIFYSSLVGGRDPGMRESAMHGALCNLLRDVVKRVALWRNASDKVSRKYESEPTGALGCA